MQRLDRMTELRERILSIVHEVHQVCKAHPEQITPEVIGEVRAAEKAWTHLAKALRRRNAHGSKKVPKKSKEVSARV